MLSQDCFTSAGNFFSGARMNDISLASLGSLNLFVAWSSKHKGVLQKSFIAD